jgi:hypothetical protein
LKKQNKKIKKGIVKMKENKARKIIIVLLLVTVLNVFFNRVSAAPPPDEQVVSVFIGPIRSKEEHVAVCRVDKCDAQARDKNGNLVFLMDVPRRSWRFFAMGAEAKGNPDTGTFSPLDLLLAASVAQDGWFIKKESRHILLHVGPAMVREWEAQGFLVFCSQNAEDVFDIRFGAIHDSAPGCPDQPVFVGLRADPPLAQR